MTQKEFIEEYAALPDEAQRLVDEFVAFLGQRSAVDLVVPRTPPGKLADETFIGMWRDRHDLVDSTAWVRNNRRSEGEVGL